MKPINKFFLYLAILFSCQDVFGQTDVLKLLEEEHYEEIAHRNNYKATACKKNYIEQSALAFSYYEMEIADKAFDAYSVLAKDYAESITPRDQLYFALVARRLENYTFSDSLILALKNDFFNGSVLFEELTYLFYEANKNKIEDYWNEFDFSKNYRIKQFKSKNKSPELGLLPLPDGTAYITQEHKETGLWRTRSSYSNHPYMVICKGDFQDSVISNVVETDLNKFQGHQYATFYDEATGILYITRNSNKSNKNHEKVLQIFAVKKERGQWIELPFKFNSEKYSVADLILSPDRSRVIFVSNMPGGYGKSDLYEAPIIANGSNGVEIGEPVNMGPEINTMLRDNFPRFNEDGQFYFSSEGHLGFGGLDIYTVDESSKMVLNVGKPVNSAMDDYCPIFNENKGVFVSNRLSKKSNYDEVYDDFYFFEILSRDTNMIQPKPTDSELLVEFYDKETGEILSNVNFALDNLNDEVSAISASTDSSGLATYNDIPIDSKVQISAHPCGYKYASTRSYVVNAAGKRVMKLELEKFKEGEDLGQLFEVNPIYYELNSYKLTDQSKRELDRVAIVLQDNPSLQIELGSHTDSRGSDEINQNLSKARAKSVYDYLASKNINRARMKYKGYGETRLLNRCKDGIECSDEEHAVNRRTEYIISGILPCDEARSTRSNKIDPKDLEQGPMKIGDADGDGIPDYLDTDSDNDGIPDASEGRRDSDKDGLPNFIDKDSDNDGIPDITEGTEDYDRDGKPNYIDTDSDNDGIKDSDEGLDDPDNDGNPNYLDIDSDGDGTKDISEATRDSDGDGILNYLDQDSDNDGIPDSVEGIKDTDRDGKPNYRDEDSDNDNIPDKIEGTKDSDKDGKPDYLDTDSDEDGIPDKYEAPANYDKYPTDVVPAVASSPKSDVVSAPAPKESPAPSVTPIEKKSTTVNSNWSTGGIESGTVYRVQFKMSLKPIRDKKFMAMGINDVYMYRSGRYYKYCTGEFSNEADANAFKNTLRRKGMRDAFVAKFKDGKRVLK